jgi:hypothetical protein
MKDENKTAEAIEELIATYVEGVKQLIDTNVAGIKALQKDVNKLEKSSLNNILLETRTSKNQLKRIEAAINGLEVNPNITVQAPKVSVPDIKIPDIKVPEVKIPEIKIPEIKVPKQDVKFPTKAKDALPVRLSDGKKFYRAIENIASFPVKFGGGGGEFAYSDSSGRKGYGLIDSDNHVQVDTLTQPDIKTRNTVTGTSEYVTAIQGNGSLALTWTDGNLTRIVKTIGATTYTKTFSYSGGNLTGISTWS